MAITTSKSLLARLKIIKDQQAWDQFYRLYSPLIVNFSQRRNCSKEMAYDVLQETMVCLIKLFPNFTYDPRKGRFGAFLFKIVSARMNDAYRRQKRYRGLDDNGDDNDYLRSLADSDVVDAGAEWDKLWDRNLLTQALENVKKRINALTWQSFEMYVLEMFSVADIAVKLNLTVVTIYQHKNRVIELVRAEIASLRQELGDYD